MGHPIRDRDPEIYRCITIRTSEARLWITPSNKVRKLIGGIVARYQEMFDIEIYAYEVLTNHLHLAVRAPRSNLDQFAENVNREIARRINWKHKRQGKLWAKRYTDLKILSLDDLLEAFLYITTNATHHGLVRNSRHWPGLNCFEHALTERDQIFPFCHHSHPEKLVTRHRLRLSVLPQFAHMSQKERRALLEGLLTKRMERLAEEREKAGKGFLTLEAIKAQIPGDRPRQVANRTRPPCYTKCPELLRQFKAEHRARISRYREASYAYRSGDYTVKFPSNCFLPPLHRVPKQLPRNHMELLALSSLK